MTEKELKPQFAIDEMTVDDLDQATEMRLQSWLDTYVNNELSVTEEWILERNKNQLSDETRAKRRERFTTQNTTGWVARDANGRIVGATTPHVDDDGTQHVGSLYVDKNWHGTGMASELMQRVVDWFDDTKPIELGVVAYNERAKAFYKKWGFEEIPNTETLFDNKIPEVKMRREVKNDN